MLLYILVSNFTLNFCYYCGPPGGPGPHFKNHCCTATRDTHCHLTQTLAVLAKGVATSY